MMSPAHGDPPLVGHSDNIVGMNAIEQETEQPEGSLSAA